MKTIALLLLAVLTAARLWLAATTPVTDDEAFVWMCAQRMDGAFFDGPAGTALAAKAGMAVLGDTPLGLRVAFPLFAALATVAAFAFGRAVFGAMAPGLWAAVGLNLAPAFQSAATHASPVTPALAFALLGLAAAVTALTRGLPFWLLSGLAVGAAANFLYASLAVLPAAALAFSAVNRHRGEWRRPGIYAASVLAALALAPAFIWNQKHNWPASALATVQTEWTFAWGALPATMASAALALNPLLALVAFVTAFHLLRDARAHVRPRLALALGAPFALLALRDLLHGNAAPFSLLALGAVLAPAAAEWLGRTVGGARLGAGVVVVAAAWSAFVPRPADDPTWRGLGVPIGQLLLENQPAGAPPLFVIAPTPDATAALNYHLARRPAGAPPVEVYLRESQDLSNQFGLWPRYDVFERSDRPADEFFRQEGNTVNPNVGRSALYLTSEAPDDLPQTITAAFSRVTPLGTLDGGPDRKLRVYLCEDYQTMPL